MDAPLVQPILVEVAGSQEDLLTAVARASLLACPSPQDPAWTPWLGASFRKTVRRLKAKDLEKVLALPPVTDAEGASLALLAQEGEARALAFPPMLYEEFPKPLKRAQVAGISLPPKAPPVGDLALLPSSSEEGITLLVDASLGMSTGKAAAQVAHGYWMAFLEELPPSVASFPPPRVFSVTASVFQKALRGGRPVVVDAGLTEVAPSTPTVAVL